MRRNSGPACADGIAHAGFTLLDAWIIIGKRIIEETDGASVRNEKTE